MHLVRNRWMAVTAVVAASVIAVYFLRGSMPWPADIGHALLTADRGWLALAAAAEFASMVMFAVQQRRLLQAFGGAMSLRRAVALTFARTGISVSLPAGGAVSAAYALRHYRRLGTTAAGAAAVTVLAGVQSVAALLLIYVAWFAMVGFGSTNRETIVFGATALAIVAAAVAARKPVAAALIRLGGRWQAPGGALRKRWVDVVTGALEDAASLSPRDWAYGGGAALANWLFDLGCLLAVARACGVTAGVVAVVGSYLLVQVVRQIPITPGGIGVVEASLLVGLVTAGATSGTAAAVVLIYRLLSCWLMAPAGLLAALALRTGHPSREDRPTSQEEMSCISGPRRTRASSSASTGRQARRPPSPGPSSRPAATRAWSKW